MSEKEYRDAVYAEANTVSTPEQLVEFIARRYGEELDYGTIVYACAATMKAAFRVMNAHPQFGGITGFQAGCLMWEMVREFGMFSEGPLRILDYEKLLYPQHDKDFSHTISRESADSLIERAKKNRAIHMHPDVAARHEAIARGEFPPFVRVEER